MNEGELDDGRVMVVIPHIETEPDIFESMIVGGDGRAIPIRVNMSGTRKMHERQLKTHFRLGLALGCLLGVILVSLAWLASS